MNTEPVKDIPVGALPRDMLVELASSVGVTNAHRQDRETLARNIRYTGVIYVRVVGRERTLLTTDKQPWTQPEDPVQSIA